MRDVHKGDNSKDARKNIESGRGKDWGLYHLLIYPSVPMLTSDTPRPRNPGHPETPQLPQTPDVFSTPRSTPPALPASRRILVSGLGEIIVFVSLLTKNTFTWKLPWACHILSRGDEGELWDEAELEMPLGITG